MPVDSRRVAAYVASCVYAASLCGYLSWLSCCYMEIWTRSCHIDNGSSALVRRCIGGRGGVEQVLFWWDSGVSLKGRISSLPGQPYWLYTLIVPQQHSPLPRKYQPTENWWSSTWLTSVIVREMAIFHLDISRWLDEQDRTIQEVISLFSRIAHGHTCLGHLWILFMPYSHIVFSFSLTLFPISDRGACRGNLAWKTAFAEKKISNICAKKLSFFTGKWKKNQIGVSATLCGL